MNTARFNFVAQRMAPHRAAVNVDWRTNGQTVTLSCGHTTEFVAHCHVKIGSEHTCRKCGEDVARKLSEFAEA